MAKNAVSNELRFKNFPGGFTPRVCFYALLNNDSQFMWVPFDVIAYSNIIVMALYYYNRLIYDDLVYK